MGRYRCPTRFHDCVVWEPGYFRIGWTSKILFRNSSVTDGVGLRGFAPTFLRLLGLTSIRV